MGGWSSVVTSTICLIRRGSTRRLRTFAASLGSITIRFSGIFFLSGPGKKLLHRRHTVNGKHCPLPLGVSKHNLCNENERDLPRHRVPPSGGGTRVAPQINDLCTDLPGGATKPHFPEKTL